MSTNNTVSQKSNFAVRPEIPANQKLEASEWNQVADFQKIPVQAIDGQFTDTNIIVDGTKEYSTTKVITGATHTITASDVDGTPNVLSSEHRQGNNIKVRYQFDVDCTVTLTNFDTTGSNTGDITPISAGTYELIFYAKARGVTLEIPSNAVSDQSQDVKPFDYIYYVKSTGNDSTAEANNPSLPWALASAASIAAKAEKDANGTNVLVYIFSGGAIKDYEINQDDIPIFAEDQAVVWTDQSGVSILSDRLLGSNIKCEVECPGQAAFIHTNPDNNNDQQTLNFRNSGSDVKLKGLLTDILQFWSTGYQKCQLDNCEILVGNPFSARDNFDLVANNCTYNYVTAFTSTQTGRKNEIYNNCTTIVENTYDKEIYDKEGNLITTINLAVPLSTTFQNRILGDAYSLRCPVTGASGDGDVNINGVDYAIVFNTSEDQTVDDFVTSHESALLATADEVTLKRWKEIQLTGTSGTANINIAGTDYLVTFNTDLETTASDFITTHKSTINTQGYRVEQFGSILAFAKITEGAFTLSITNATGDLSGTISYQFYLKAVYANYITASYVQNTADLTVLFNNYYTLEELENEIGNTTLDIGQSGQKLSEFGYSGIYYDNFKGSKGIKAILNQHTVILRKPNSIGGKILYRVDQDVGKYAGFIITNFRVLDESGGETSALIYGKNDALVTPAEIDLFSIEHNCDNSPSEISADGYSEPVIRSNDPDIDNSEIVEKNVLFKKQATVQGKTLTFTATPTFNFDDGNVQKMILTSNVTSLSISNELGSGSYRIFLQQDGVGGRTIATPDSTFGTKTDNSVSDFITAANDVNIIDIAIDPDGTTYYSIETITA